MKWTVWLAVLILLLVRQAWSLEWRGHLSTLGDARIACSDTHNKECQPFLAQAVAVAHVMQELSVVDTAAKEDFCCRPLPSRESNPLLAELAEIHERFGVASFDPRISWI